ncbi:MAG: phosphotransferase [Actinobacteria bacterium]|nr:phosphotransferase [Actinomycetota bacterium]
MQFDNGTRAFVKGATNPETAAWLTNEFRLLELVGGRFGPEVIAWLGDEERPVLVAEDLSTAYWPADSGTTQWRPGDIDAVLAALEQLRAHPAGKSLRPAPWPRPCWSRLVERSIPVRLGLCSQDWLDRHGPKIISFDDRAACDGSSIVHGDVRSDNLCLFPDGQIRLVDWSNSGTGHPLHDLIALLPTLHLEGGPTPASMLPKPVELIVRLAGPTIARAASRREMPEWLRDVLRRLALIQFAWITEIMDLRVEPPQASQS